VKYLFCGLGSIGQRHLKNLIECGEKNIIAFRSKKNYQKDNLGVKQFYSLKKAFSEKPDIVFITNPSSLHLKFALLAAKNKSNIFIEKPLGTNLNQAKKLLETIRASKRLVFVGFMMRYHPAVIKIKELLNKNYIGKILYCNLTCGEFLPLWHPKEDYAKGYSARRELGGGVIFTLCHEVDLLTYFLGCPESVFAFSGHLSNMVINTEDVAEILFRYKDGVIANIHLDFLQNPPKRQWYFIGENGRIEFDYFLKKITVYRFNRKGNINIETFKFKKFERNDMFASEIKSFIDSVKNKKEAEISLEDGIRNLKILLAIHKSVRLEKMIEIN